MAAGAEVPAGTAQRLWALLVSAVLSLDEGVFGAEARDAWLLEMLRRAPELAAAPAMAMLHAHTAITKGAAALAAEADARDRMVDTVKRLKGLGEREPDWLDEWRRTTPVLAGAGGDA